MVGFCIARSSPNAVRVLDFMLSCRVQGKFIEQALFNYLVESGARVESLEINFQKTDRNVPAQMGDNGVLVRAIAPGDFAVDFMSVVNYSHS
jgi:predicted enzyme involved in methoxymalonyl-ACP biosynthesis